MEQKVMAIKQAQETNKQKLSSTRGTRPKPSASKGTTRKVYRVQLVNGQQQKTLLNGQKAASSGGREGRVKEHVIEKKTGEYQQYGQQIGALAKQYTTANPEALMQAKQAGNISIQPGGGCLELGHQELLEVWRLDDHDDQWADPFAGRRPGQLVPERSQKRGYHLRTVRAVAGWDQSRRNHRDRRCK
jgi:hypothetical protein